MLREVLQAIETADGPVHVATLSQRLGIERTAGGHDCLLGAQRPLVQESDAATVAAPSCGHCGTTCAGVHDCPFVARMPKSYTVQSVKTLQDPCENRV